MASKNKEKASKKDVIDSHPFFEQKKQHSIDVVLFLLQERIGINRTRTSSMTLSEDI